MLTLMALPKDLFFQTLSDFFQRSVTILGIVVMITIKEEDASLYTGMCVMLLRQIT